MPAVKRAGLLYPPLTSPPLTPPLLQVTYPLDERGVVLLRGSNLDDSGADSNGAGKTTLAMSALWALAGVVDARYCCAECSWTRHVLSVLPSPKKAFGVSYLTRRARSAQLLPLHSSFCLYSPFASFGASRAWLLFSACPPRPCPLHSTSLHSTCCSSCRCVRYIPHACVSSNTKRKTPNLFDETRIRPVSDGRVADVVHEGTRARSPSSIASSSSSSSPSDGEFLAAALS